MSRNIVTASLFAIALMSAYARADDVADVKAAASAVVTAIAQGDKKTLDANFAGEDIDRKFAGAMLAMVDGVNKLHDVSVARFGAADVGGNRLDPAKLIAGIDSAKATITGDTATITFAEKQDTMQGMQLRRGSGVWKVTRLTGKAPASSIMLNIMTCMADATRGTADEVKDGKYESFKQAQEAVKTKVAAAMQQKGITATSRPAIKIPPR